MEVASRDGMHGHLLAHFWELASVEGEARQRAACALSKALAKEQAEHEAGAGADHSTQDEPHADSVVHALRRCSPIVVYVFNRLCRGLASSRQGARQGFSLAITSMLTMHCIDPLEAVAAIDGLLERVGKGSELKEALLGRIFGYGAVVRSGRLLPTDLACRLAGALVQVAQKKSFLGEVAAGVLLELCHGVDDSTLLILANGALAPWLKAHPTDAAPEMLLLALRLWPRLPATVVQACPLLPASPTASEGLPATLVGNPTTVAGSTAAQSASSAFFARQHLTALLPVLRATTCSHPRLHGVWPVMLALLVPGFSADKEQRNAGASGAADTTCLAPVPLQAFWSCVVDGDLVRSSHERKYLAFALFVLLLPHLEPEHVPLVFTPALLRCLATNLSKGDSHLHAGAKRCVQLIAAHCSKAAPDMRVAVSAALQRHGGLELERCMSTRALDAATAGGEEPGASSTRTAARAGDLGRYVEQVQRTFLEADSGATGSHSAQQRLWALEQLSGVLKRTTTPTECNLRILQFLAVHAFFSVSNVEAAQQSNDDMVRAAIGVDISLFQRQLCAARLISLADALDKRQHHFNGGRQQQDGVPLPGEHVASIAAFVTQLHRSGVVDLVIAPEGWEAAASLERTTERVMTAMQSVPRALQPRLRTLARLLQLLLLHSLADPTAADPTLAADLAAVCAAAVKEGADGADGTSTARVGSPNEKEEQPHWHDMLMDVLLSMLAHNAAPLPAAPLREAVNHVFRAFADDLTATGMNDMLRVLTKPLSSSGTAEDEDVLVASAEQDFEPDEVEVEDEGEEEGHAERERDGGADQIGSSSGDEEDMSDDAMFGLDAKLAQYFAVLKEGRAGGGNAQTARQELLHFKMRVATLFEAFCKRVPASPLLPAAVSPLLSALASASRPGGHHQLAERLSGLIVHRLCSSKASGAVLPAEELETQLRRTLFLASRATDKRVAAAAGAGYIFLQRAAAASRTLECQMKGLHSAQAAVSDFFLKKKSRLQRTLLETLLRRVPSLVPRLLPATLHHAAAARNEYLRLEAFVLLATALKSGGATVPAALADHHSTAIAAVLAAVSKQYSKSQRHVEALKVACELIEHVRSAKSVSGSNGGWREVQHATACALHAAAGDAKLVTAFRRVENLLAEETRITEQGSKHAGPGGKAARAAKKQRQQ